MRLTTTVKLLLVGAAGLIAVGLSGIAPAERPSTDRHLTIVIEDPAGARPAAYDCPYEYQNPVGIMAG